MKRCFSLGISLTQNPQHLRLTSICSHSIKLSYLLSYINLVLNSVSHELKRSLFHAKLRIFGYKTISMIKNIQGIFWLWMWNISSLYLETFLFIVLFKLVLNLHFNFRRNPIDICKTVSKNFQTEIFDVWDRHWGKHIWHLWFSILSSIFWTKRDNV